MQVEHAQGISVELFLSPPLGRAIADSGETGNMI